MFDENLEQPGLGNEPSTGGETPSIEQTIRETYSRLISEHRDDEGGDDADAGVQEPKQKQQSAKAQARGADGRFTRQKDQGGQPQQPNQEQQPGQQQQQQAQPQQGQQPQQQQPQPKPHDRYPQTWRRDEALTQAWSTLPENVREEIHRREQSIHDGLRQYRDAAAFGSAIAREMLPYQKIMQERGVEPRALIRDIMAALNTMATGSDQQKAQTFLKLAADYGINLDTVLSLRSRAPAQVAPELSDALQRIQRLEAHFTNQLQEQEQRQLAEDEALVQRFLNDPKYEHARTVQREMAALLQSGQAESLEDAYEQALWLNPQTRKLMLEKQEQERRQRDAQEAAAARKAGAANVERRGAPSTPQKPGTMEDTIRSTYRKLMG